MPRIDLFVIDGQNDFCASGNMPQYDSARRGALFVEGADKEALNVANMIARLGPSISKIHATLDSHHFLDGAHNIAWHDCDGQIAPPFTLINHADVQSKKWTPRFPFGVWHGTEIPASDWALLYTEALEESDRGPLCLWPVHCQIGTWGSDLYYPLSSAFDRWCELSASWIDFIHKGQWVWTEHYSGLKADVPDRTRKETQLNASVIEDASNADTVLWCGWAGSHCLRYTALDAINYFGEGANEFSRKCVFFEDASAPVPDIPGADIKFSQWRQTFLDHMCDRGATVTTTDNFNV